ncbi:MAG: sulfatase-like hydrolase/transferase [Chloroflexi bacterium]|jgi:arylsulfatase A-like enzyme|nr:sulfatase-like hydrolase/transferase [Chloroflexota bacterium]
MNDKKPNIILFIVDNMCAWTLGTYGNPDAYTPNLDRMAAQGIQFNNCYGASALCSPGRASLLTGVMPSAHGVHLALPDSEGMYPEDWCALDGFESLSGTLKDNSYNTAMIGKWHLGDYPTKHPQTGFDYWVCKEDGHTSDFWGDAYWEDGKRHVYEGHMTELWTNKALDYLQDHANDQEPFFMYVSYNAPYSTSGCLDAEINGKDKNPFWPRFENKEMESMPREPVAQEAISYAMMINQVAPQYGFQEEIRGINNMPRLRNVFSQISYVDDGIGQIMTELQKLGLDDDTIVMFTADHGTSYGQNGNWGTGWTTIPFTGHRHGWSIPLIMRYPGRIAAGQESDLMVMQTDIYSTLLDLAETDYTPNGHSPGSSLAPLLRSEKLEGDFDAVFCEIHELRLMRTREWLYIKHFDKQNENELYDLLRDPGEHRNVISDPSNADVLAEMDAALAEFFKEHAAPEYDVWNGGTMVASIVPPIDEAPYKAAYGEDWKPIFPMEA